MRRVRLIGSSNRISSVIRTGRRIFFGNAVGCRDGSNPSVVVFDGNGSAGTCYAVSAVTVFSRAGKQCHYCRFREFSFCVVVRTKLNRCTERTMRNIDAARIDISLRRLIPLRRNRNTCARRSIQRIIRRSSSSGHLKTNVQLVRRVRFSCARNGVHTKIRTRRRSFLCGSVCGRH